MNKTTIALALISVSNAMAWNYIPDMPIDQQFQLQYNIKREMQRQELNEQMNRRLGEGSMMREDARNSMFGNTGETMYLPVPARAPAPVYAPIAPAQGQVPSFDTHAAQRSLDAALDAMNEIGAARVKGIWDANAKQ